MANTFIKASFVIALTLIEADLLHKCCETARKLADREIPDDERAAHFASLGPDFTAAFPPSNEDPFSGFLAIFDDPEFPHLDCTVVLDDPDGERQNATIFGDQINVELIAQLIFRLCKSALPFGFEYTLDCDGLRPGQFGGGLVIITKDGIEHGGTSTMLDRALAREKDEGADGYVLAIRDPEHGLSFWNNDSGFGRLGEATVFSEKEAAQFDKPIANDEPEWLAMPAPLPL